MSKTRIICFTEKGYELGSRLTGILDGSTLYAKTRTDLDVEKVASMDRWVKDSFESCDCMVFIGATGIAVRHIAPYLKDKTTDPAVICIDELGINVIPLVSGHIGGANALAKRIAMAIDGNAVITTATDINGLFAVDTFATRNDLAISSMGLAKAVSSRVLSSKSVGICSDFGLDDVPSELTPCKKGEFGICISGTSKAVFDRTLVLTPKCHVLGIGCRRGIEKWRIDVLVQNTLTESMIPINSIASIASIDLKSNEAGLLEFAEDNGIPIGFFSSEELNSLDDVGFSKSEMVKGVTGVDCVCERSAVLASDGGDLIVKKRAKDGVTLSIARRRMTFNLGRDSYE